ncbi:hypothetical protein B7P43_G00811 [Cryptotermes secundus]|uniref:Mos1 transposase HTH domain-containing protein n=1 Tax=Cryptotermes secundus TaxID=105785 RepID=A0A2J7QSI6_9NEOP|nr:hypothetical protein B7P43_G00811 [Cryptotermes secundus]
MTDLREQRVCIKFCFKLRKTDAETHQMFKQAFGENSLGQTQSYDWYERFKNGRTTTEDNDRSGRPSTGTTLENVAKVRDVIQKQHRLEVCRELQQQLQEDPNFLSKSVTGDEIVPHPPYSPDLAPCDFFLFPKMKIKLKGRRFDRVEEIQAETQTALNTLTKKHFQGFPTNILYAFLSPPSCYMTCPRHPP